MSSLRNLPYHLHHLPLPFALTGIVSPMAPLTVLIASGLVLYFTWRLVRNYVVGSPLDKIPGPPSGSIISGALDIDCRWTTRRLILNDGNRKHLPDL